MLKPAIEACVSSLPECVAAQNNGADRIELCSRLDLDGLTPDYSLISAALDALDIPVKVMIRPREGDFSYTSEEKALIKDQITKCKQLGVTHFVYGSILEGRLDIEDIVEVYNYIRQGDYPVQSFMIHKAIDASTAPLDDLARILTSFPFVPGIKLAVLSSGGDATALAGSELLRKMVVLAGEKIEIVVAGKVTAANLDQVIATIPCRAYHGRRIVSLGSK